MTRLFSLFGALCVTAGLALATADASARLPAQEHEHDQHAAAGATQLDDNALSDGEVRKIDKDSGKLTIKHGPLANLGMGGMTMAFKVTDPALLDTVKVGDQIHFRAERVNGALAVTKLELSK